jgi:hypothetical protein
MRANALLRTGIATCATAVLSLVVAAPAPSYATTLAMTLSSTTGPSGGGNPITATVTSAGALAFPAGTEPTVQFQYSGSGAAAACRASAQDDTQIDGTASTLTAGVLTVDPDEVRRISATKIAFAVPSSSAPENVDGLALLDGQTTSDWNVCFYDSSSTTTSTLIAAATYTLALRPTITSILPASSPALGGQSITVNGAGFSAGTTASIDGAELSNLQLAANGNSFTADTSAHVGGTGYALTVTTIGGVVSSADPDNDDSTPDAPIWFSFDNSVSIDPNTAPAGSSVNVDIRGEGFDELGFVQNAAPTDPSAHVFLVRDDYDPVDNRGVQECTDVLAVSSSELVCTLDLSADRLDPTTSAPVVGEPVTEGTYTITVVADGSLVPADSADASTLSSGATLTIAPH